MVYWLLTRLIPVRQLLMWAAVVALLQLLGVDVIGMASGWLADWLGFSWDGLLSW